MTLAALATLLVTILPQQPAAALTHGPLRGPADATSLTLWARGSEPGRYVLHLRALPGGAESAWPAEATAASDHVLQWHPTGLVPGAAHDWWIAHGERTLVPPGGAPLATAPRDDAGAATIVFGSCADERAFPEQPIWGQILARAPQAMVLLGDTPYIDDATVEGRRRRFRAFYEFAPVCAVLQAVPTWATWDDHDYARNDTFGAVQGGETARQVFCEYHAHPVYGDGASGIHTSFRRGPLEVFLLDTRSFADVETSVFAAGKRSLLGRAQGEWLQRGLLASTAPFKVLACGMVWNGGVRPDKKDCWGNWLDERDALLRWLGSQQVPGVVLVGGDVHRSRVIVHPTRALCGYDVPELIASPLAANVLASNAVDVPGLAFDAGEEHSCLVLTTAGSGGDATLGATFVAGDGREFHVRKFTLAELSATDAATSYRAASAALYEAFGADLERVPETDFAVDGGIDGKTADSPAWREAVTRAAPALAHWQQALTHERCRFRRLSKDAIGTEFFDLLRPMVLLRQLAAARAEQALVDGRGEELVAAARGLLAMARHLHQASDGLAWAFASTCELHVAGMTQRATAGKSPSAAGLQTAVQQHLAARTPIAGLAVVIQEEAERTFAVLLRTMQTEDGPNGAGARQFATEVQRKGRERVQAYVAPLLALTGPPTEEFRQRLQQHEADTGKDFAGVQKRLKDRDAAAAAKATAADDLAVLLVAVATPPLLGLYDGQAAALRALLDCAGR